MRSVERRAVWTGARKSKNNEIQTQKKGGSHADTEGV